MAEYRHVRIRIEDRVGILTIDHPPANALSRATLSDIDAALEELFASEQAKVIVITGAGDFAFVAGADIKEFPALATTEDARAFLLRGHAVMNKIEDSPKPVIAAINGLALGGGLELALACHMRILSDRARIGQPEIKLGLIPGWGGTQRLPRLIGLGRALEWILTGDMVDAGEAYRLGLANKVAPADALLAETISLANKIAAKSALTHRAALKAVFDGLKLSAEEGDRSEVAQFAGLAGSHDFAEGPAAFLEKRPPNFTDS